MFPKTHKSIEQEIRLRVKPKIEKEDFAESEEAIFEKAVVFGKFGCREFGLERDKKK